MITALQRRTLSNLDAFYGKDMNFGNSYKSIPVMIFEVKKEAFANTLKISSLL
jgi:hypothetical protein